MQRISYNELPEGFLSTLLNVQAYVENSGLDHSLLKLIKMRVSQINGCAYCIDMHFKDAIAAGETAQRLISVGVWRDAPYYSEKEKAVLAFAERLTRLNPEEDSSDIHDGLLPHFSKQEIALLTLAITQINTWNRVVRSTGIVAGTYKTKETAAAL